MKPFSWRFIRVWQRNRDVFFRLWRSEIPVMVAEPIIILLAMGLGLGTYVGLVNGQSYIEFVAPGIIAGESDTWFVWDAAALVVPGASSRNGAW